MVKKRLSAAPALILIAVMLAVLATPLTMPQPALAATVASFSGMIASGPEYDLYTVTLGAAVPVTATLICAEIAPGNRPLDPVLSVFFPGSDPTDTVNADVYNDDGFGLDDDPSGVDCNAFDSSRVIFTTPVAGTYTFRADGFGSSTGPYALTIFDNSVAGCDVLMPLPSTAVVGAFVADAALYAEPGVTVSPALTMVAGKTAWVLGVDSSDQYYRIIWVCSYVYVPKATMGPNYDAVWQGRPLPTIVSEPTGK